MKRFVATCSTGANNEGDGRSSSPPGLCANGVDPENRNDDAFARVGLAFAIVRNKPNGMTAKQYAQLLQRRFFEALWSSRCKRDGEVTRLKYELALERTRPQNGSVVMHMLSTPPSSNKEPAIVIRRCPDSGNAAILDAVLCLSASRGGEAVLPVDPTTVIQTSNALQVLAEHVRSILLDCRKPTDEQSALQKLVLDALMRTQPCAWSFVDLTQKTFLETLVRQFILENDNRFSRTQCLDMLVHFTSVQSALRRPLVEVLLNTLTNVVAELSLVSNGVRLLNGLLWRNSMWLLEIINRIDWAASDLRANPFVGDAWHLLINQCVSNLCREFPLFVEAICRVAPQHL